MRVRNTNAFHGSITMNSLQDISNRRRYRLESTESPFRRVESYERYCDLSTDLGERATLENFSATRRLRGSLRLLASLIIYSAMKNNSRLGLFMSFAICISITRSDNIVILTIKQT